MGKLAVQEQWRHSLRVLRASELKRSLGITRELYYEDLQRRARRLEVHRLQA